MHSTLVGLILNPILGNISPQFHVVYDNLFTTVNSNEAQVNQDLARLISFPNAHLQVLLDNEWHPDLDDDWLTVEEIEARDNEEQMKVVQTSGTTWPIEHARQ